MSERIERSEIRGALARGYCTKENERKVLDSVLLEAMADELEELLTDLQIELSWMTKNNL